MIKLYTTGANNIIKALFSHCQHKLNCTNTLLRSRASWSSNEVQFLVCRAVLPAGHVKLRSWPLSAYTSCICLEGARLHTSSHATSGKGCETEREWPSAYYEDTSCIVVRLPNPNLWCYGQNHLPGNKVRTKVRAKLSGDIFSTTVGLLV